MRGACKAYQEYIPELCTERKESGRHSKVRSRNRILPVGCNGITPVTVLQYRKTIKTCKPHSLALSKQQVLEQGVNSNDSAFCPWLYHGSAFSTSSETDCLCLPFRNDLYRL